MTKTTTIANLDMALDVLKAESNGCPGLFWRATENIYVKNDAVKTTRQLRLLRRMSCKGCPDCAWFLDYMYEDITGNPEVNMLDDIKGGKIYTYSVDSCQDWESGNWEIDGINFVEWTGSDNE